MASSRTVLEHLASSSLACSFLEIPLLYRMLQSVQKRIEPRTTGDCVTILLRGLMVGLFLLRFEAPDVYDALANPSPAGRPSAIPGVLPEQRG